MILYPDLGAYEKWNTKAAEIQRLFCCNIFISKLLDDIAISNDKTNGLDVSDFIIKIICN